MMTTNSLDGFHPTTSTVTVEDPATRLKKSLASNPAFRNTPPGRSKKLISLEDWNHAHSQPESAPHKNNIACPKCGKELYDVDSVCYSNHNGAFRSIACECCNWSGERRI